VIGAQSSPDLLQAGHWRGSLRDNLNGTDGRFKARPRSRPSQWPIGGGTRSVIRLPMISDQSLWRFAQNLAKWGSDEPDRSKNEADLRVSLQ
jgi:hypothetical protein